MCVKSGIMKKIPKDRKTILTVPILKPGGYVVETVNIDGLLQYATEFEVIQGVPNAMSPKERKPYRVI
jgi:hypothetical protein